MSNKFSAFFKGGQRKRDGNNVAPSPTPSVVIVKSPYDAMAKPSTAEGVTVVAPLSPREAPESPASPVPVQQEAAPAVPSAKTAPEPPVEPAKARRSNMLNDLMGTFDELLVSKELEAVQEEAKASVYTLPMRASSDMKIDPSKGVARSSHMVGAPRPRNEEDDSDDSGDEETVDDGASTRHRGGHDAVARHLNIVEDLATANPDVPTVYEDRKSRRKKDMDENDLLTLAESVRLSRSQRGAWLKDKGMPGSPSVESLNSPGGSSPSDGASPANPDLSGSSPGEEDAGNHGSPEDRDFRLAMNAAVKQVTDAEMEKPRSPGVSILASSPVETYVPADSSLPMGAGEEWMNALIRENTLVAQIGSQNRGASTSVAYMQPLVGATVAEKVQAFEAVAG